MVLRIGLGGNPSFATVLASVHAKTLAAAQNRDVALGEILAALDAESAAGPHSIFQVMFALRDGDSDGGGASAASAESIAAGRPGVELALTLDVAGSAPGERRIAGRLEFDADMFDPETAEELAERYLLVLEQVTAEPTVPVPPRSPSRRSPPTTSSG